MRSMEDGFCAVLSLPGTALTPDKFRDEVTVNRWAPPLIGIPTFGA
jgi:hypothetical protein